jgi:hypothetical protein
MALQIAPNPVIFRNVTPGTPSSLDVVVRNIGKKTIQLRFSVPVASPFSISTGKTFFVPEGLEARILLICATSADTVARSILAVHTNIETEALVPIIAYPAAFKFCEPELDLGRIAPGCVKAQRFRFANGGAATAYFRFVASEPRASIEPAAGAIGPGQTLQATLTLDTAGMRACDFAIAGEVEGSPEPIAALRVRGTIVDQSISVLFDGAPFAMLDFGFLFFGEKKTYQVTLVNRSFAKRPFVTEIGADEPAFLVRPAAGEIPPRGSLVVTVSFAPPVRSSESADLSFVGRASFVMTDGGQASGFDLKGCGSPVRCAISVVDFSFGRLKVNTKASRECAIENQSEHLPLTFSFKLIAHFSFKPQSGSIPANSSRLIRITFSPKSPGDFDLKSSIQFCQGLFTREISLIGIGSNEDSARPVPDFGESEECAKQSPTIFVRRTTREPGQREHLAKIERQRRKYTQGGFDELVTARGIGCDLMTLEFTRAEETPPAELTPRRIREPIVKPNRSARWSARRKPNLTIPF